MVEWTMLDPFPATDFDTPELIKAREACNAEIEAILTKRQDIEQRLSVAQNSPVERLTVEQLEAGKQAKSERFLLLQQELQFRKGVYPQYLELSRETASRAATLQDKIHKQIEAEVIAGLEKLGYRTPQVVEVPGSWSGEMVYRHPRVIASRFRNNALTNHGTDYSPKHQNTADQETLNRLLNSVRNALVG